MKYEIIKKSDLDKSNVYISVSKYCELKNVSFTTFWRLRKSNNFPYQIVKIDGYGKMLFIVVKKGTYFIDKNDNLIVVDRLD